MKLTLFCCLLVCSLGLANLRGQEANKPEEKKPMDTNQKEVAVLKTTAGEMVVEFWPEVAPKTVENFKKLANKGFYNGTAFHRIMKGFMIQGGDPLTKDATKEARWGTGDPGYKVKAEFNDHASRGVLSMARRPIRLGRQPVLHLPRHRLLLDQKYTAFGKVIKGEDVLDKIGATRLAKRGGEISKPQTRIALESVKIVPADSVK